MQFFIFVILLCFVRIIFEQINLIKPKFMTLLFGCDSPLAVLASPLLNGPPS